METSLKTGFAQIFSYCPKALSCSNFGGAAAPSLQSRPSHTEEIQLNFYSHFNKIFTLYMVRYEYTNKGEEEGKKKINGLDRSVRWSEELSFRANHRYIMSGNT